MCDGPLLASMSEQVRSVEDLGIRAVHLCAETIQANGGIIQAVRRENTQWYSNFSGKLQYIMVDEVYLVHEWLVVGPPFSSHVLRCFDRTFRPRVQGMRQSAIK